MGLAITPRELPPASLTSQLGRRAARAALRSGRSTSVRRGALVPAIPAGKPWEEDEARALATIASAARKLRNGAAFSHASAALVHGLWVVSIPERPELTQPSRPNSHGVTSLRRHRGDLPSGHVTTAAGVRVTTIERTVADCARTMAPHHALAVVDSGIRARLRTDRFRRDADRTEVADLRARLLQMVDDGPPRGRRQARAVIGAADPYAESPMETVIRWVAVSRGLPPPVTQMAVRTREGIFYADLGWRWVVRREDGTEEVHIVLVEYDGELKYLPDGGIVTSLEDSSAAMVKEKRREDLIRENPRTAVVRFSRLDVHDHDKVFARLLAVVPPEARRDLIPVPELLLHPRP